METQFVLPIIIKSSSNQKEVVILFGDKQEYEETLKNDVLITSPIDDYLKILHYSSSKKYRFFGLESTCNDGRTIHVTEKEYDGTVQSRILQLQNKISDFSFSCNLLSDIRFLIYPNETIRIDFLVQSKLD